MKKALTLALCALLSVACISCNDDNDTNTGNNNNENNNNENNNNENNNNNDEFTDKTGQACTEPLFEGPYVYECADGKLKLFRKCTDGRVGYTEYSEEDEDYIAGCYEPCTKAEEGKVKTGCYGETFFLQGPLECMQMTDTLYVYNMDPEKTDDFIACPGDCKNDKCVQLAGDEGQPCDETTFKSRCEGNVLVTCEDKVTVTEKCDQFAEDNEICGTLADGSGAGCVVNEPCATLNATKYECYNESLDALTCKAAKDGKNYFFYDFDKSVFDNCPKCNADKGTCN